MTSLLLPERTSPHSTVPPYSQPRPRPLRPGFAPRFRPSARARAGGGSMRGVLGAGVLDALGRRGQRVAAWLAVLAALALPATAQAQTVTTVAITSNPVLETDTYGAGERIEVTVTFSAAVNATDATTFVLSVGGDDTRAPLLFGSGTTRLVFSYTVGASDEDDNGIWIGDQDRTLVGDRMGLTQEGAITSVATPSTAVDLTHAGLGTDADHKVDGSRSIVSVAVSSTPGLETDTYGAGETIRFTVTFSSGVNIGTSPAFRFSLGNLGVGRQVDAAYESGAGSAALVFGYTVVSSDEDNDGIWIGHQGQTLVGSHQTGTITIVATSEPAGLTHAALGVQSGHKVDGSRTGNNAPVFDPATATREVEENSPAGTNVGAVIPEATDADSGDTLTYSMEGTDAASFAFDASTRQITTITGVDYNYEATKNSYSVTVKASDGTASATIAVTIDVTDDTEKSAKPAKPTLAAVMGSSTTLTATWTEPDLNGGPEITGYDVQYKVSTDSSWTAFAHTGEAVATTITGLTADTSYQVQVRAKNGETDSDWSDASDAVSTNAEIITPPPPDPPDDVDPADANDGTVRLVDRETGEALMPDGMTEVTGIVEIAYNDEWRSVCDDSWTYRGARVVCRELGYTEVERETVAALIKLSFGPDDSEDSWYWLDDVNCEGNEATLLECPHADIGEHNCGAHERAGVTCGKGKTADTRLRTLELSD